MPTLAARVRSSLPYAVLVASLAVLSLAARALFSAQPHLVLEIEFQVFVLGGVLFTGYCINRVAPKTVIPSFVWAIFAGLALQPLLEPYVGDVSALKVVMEIFAAIILFAGGLEIPFRNFRKWFFAIASLSLVGVILSAILFSVLIVWLLKAFGGFDAALLPTVVILGAALASTDPTAIIPTLANLRFKRGFLKQIAISESALTDVSGSIITRFLLLALLGATAAHQGVFGLFAPLFRRGSYDALSLQIISGIVVGYLGYRLIKAFYDRSEREGKEGGDPALLLAVPIFTFSLGNILGGAGFLASFMAGLFSEVTGSLKKVAHFYDSFLNHLVKPFIFIVLGALVPIGTLIELAPIGILAALAFMFVVRPLVVFIALLPWLWSATFTVRDLLFLSFIRETGIIAAVLVIIASGSPAIDSEFAVAVGMWVILLTLVIEPPLTPWVAKSVGVAEEKRA